MNRLNIPYRLLGAALLVAALSALVLQRAQAGDGHYFPPVTDPVVKEECGSCHMAFAPSMLPARSWRQMMGSLDKHFGDNASVDAATAERITRVLVAQAGDAPGAGGSRRLLSGVPANAAPQRITELPAWKRAHREVPGWEWRHKDVRTKANCMACHTGADKGFYED